MVREVSCPDCYSGGLRSIPVGPVDVGFTSNKVALGQVFLRVLWFTPVNVIPVVPNAHWDVRLVSLRFGLAAVEKIRTLSGPRTLILESSNFVVLLTSRATELFTNRNTSQ